MTARKLSSGDINAIVNLPIQAPPPASQIAIRPTHTYSPATPWLPISQIWTSSTGHVPRSTCTGSRRARGGCFGLPGSFALSVRACTGAPLALAVTEFSPAAASPPRASYALPRGAGAASSHGGGAPPETANAALRRMAEYENGTRFPCEPLERGLRYVVLRSVTCS